MKNIMYLGVLFLLFSAPATFAGERFTILTSDLYNFSPTWMAYPVNNQLPANLDASENYFAIYTAGVNNSIPKAAFELKIIAKATLVESRSEYQGNALVVEAIPAKNDGYMLREPLIPGGVGLTKVEGATFGVIDGKITSYYPNGNDVTVKTSRIEVLGDLPENPELVGGKILHINP